MSSFTTNKLRHPSTILVSGPTGSGKTQLVLKLVERNWFCNEHSAPIQIHQVYCLYSVWQPAYDSLRLNKPNTKFIMQFDEGVYESINPRVNNLILLDDAKLKLGDSELLERLFTEGSHHRNITVIYIVHNIFAKSTRHREISLNTHYMFLFGQPRDSEQIDRLGRQMFGPGGGAILREAYDDATSKPHSYLLVDARQETPKAFRLRTNICPAANADGATPTVYIPNKYMGTLKSFASTSQPE